jgi:hypothetical protein
VNTREIALKRELEPPHEEIKLTLKAYVIYPPGKEAHHSHYLTVTFRGGSGRHYHVVRELPLIVPALRKALQVLEGWRGIAPSGELSQTVYADFIDPELPVLVAKTRDNHYQWVCWTHYSGKLGPQVSVNLSLAQVEKLITELERIPTLAQEMIEALKALPSG